MKGDDAARPQNIREAGVAGAGSRSPTTPSDPSRGFMGGWSHRFTNTVTRGNTGRSACGDDGNISCYMPSHPACAFSCYPPGLVSIDGNVRDCRIGGLFLCDFDT